MNNDLTLYNDFLKTLSTEELSYLEKIHKVGD